MSSSTGLSPNQENQRLLATWQRVAGLEQPQPGGPIRVMRQPIGGRGVREGHGGSRVTSFGDVLRELETVAGERERVAPGMTVEGLGGTGTEDAAHEFSHDKPKTVECPDVEEIDDDVDPWWKNTKMEKDVSVGLRCPICQEIYNNPHSLECGHTFCGHCIFQWFANKSPPEKKCPTCRNRVQLPNTACMIPNRPLDQLMSIQLEPHFPEKDREERKRKREECIEKFKEERSKTSQGSVEDEAAQLLMVYRMVQQRSQAVLQRSRRLVSVRNACRGDFVDFVSFCNLLFETNPFPACRG